MKKIVVFLLLVSHGSFSQIPVGEDDVQNQPVRNSYLPIADVRIVRWISPVLKDFESMPEGRHTDAQLQSWGFKSKIYQYSAYRTRRTGMIGVYRWTMPKCNSSIMLGEHEHTDAQLQSWGYKDKEFQFYAYKNKPTTGDFVAVNRWINAKPKGDDCYDFTLSVVETELTDEQLTSWGYSSKMLQFWVPRPKSSSAYHHTESNATSHGNSVSTNQTTRNSETIQTIRIDDINEWLCPSKHTRGDREFDGNGPLIKTEVRLRMGNDGTSLYADITFWAQETKHDWSTAEGRWVKKVYDAPYGKKIRRVVSDMASRTQFVSPAAGFEILVPGQDVAKSVSNFLGGFGGSISRAIFAIHGIPAGNLEAYTRLVSTASRNGDTEVRVPAVEGALVKFFTIVGDTGGGDISDDNNCNGDTRIVKIEFAPVKIEWQ